MLFSEYIQNAITFENLHGHYPDLCPWHLSDRILQESPRLQILYLYSGPTEVFVLYMQSNDSLKI